MVFTISKTGTLGHTYIARIHVQRSLVKGFVQPRSLARVRRMGVEGVEGDEREHVPGSQGTEGTHQIKNALHTACRLLL